MSKRERNDYENGSPPFPLCNVTKDIMQVIIGFLIPRNIKSLYATCSSIRNICKQILFETSHVQFGVNIIRFGWRVDLVHKYLQQARARVIKNALHSNTQRMMNALDKAGINVYKEAVEGNHCKCMSLDDVDGALDRLTLFKYFNANGHTKYMAMAIASVLWTHLRTYMIDIALPLIIHNISRGDDGTYALAQAVSFVAPDKLPKHVVEFIWRHARYINKYWICYNAPPLGTTLPLPEGRLSFNCDNHYQIVNRVAFETSNLELAFELADMRSSSWGRKRMVNGVGEWNNDLLLNMTHTSWGKMPAAFELLARGRINMSYVTFVEVAQRITNMSDYVRVLNEYKQYAIIGSAFADMLVITLIDKCSHRDRSRVTKILFTSFDSGAIIPTRAMVKDVAERCGRNKTQAADWRKLLARMLVDPIDSSDVNYGSLISI
jgi:hypothetical protein